MIGNFKYEIVGGHTSTTAGGTAATVTIPGGDVDVLAIQALTENIRYRLDGTNPTASTGFQIAAGQSDLIPITGAQSVKIIAETGTASVQYQFLRIVSGTV